MGYSRARAKARDILGLGPRHGDILGLGPRHGDILGLRSRHGIF